MVLLAAEIKHNSTQTDDGFHDADAEIILLQMGSLFDMGLQKTNIVVIRCAKALPTSSRDS